MMYRADSGVTKLGIRLSMDMKFALLVDIHRHAAHVGCLCGHARYVCLGG